VKNAAGKMPLQGSESFHRKSGGTVTMEDAAGQRFCIRSLDTYRVWTNNEKFEEQKAKTDQTKKISQGTSLSLN